MTYREFRAFGYVSKIGQIVCKGPSQSLVNTETANLNAETNLANEEAAQGQTNQTQALALEQPLIQQETALASGNRESALAAAMPAVSEIAGGYAGAKQSIFNDLPAGASRDAALANLDLQKSTGIASAQAQQVQQAPSALAALGQGMGAFSLQQLGAALSGYSGATSTANSAANIETAQSQAKWQPITSIMGTAGSLAGNIGASVLNPGGGGMPTSADIAALTGNTGPNAGSGYSTSYGG